MATTFVERIAVEIDGEGDPVVMIHGLGGTSNTWAALGPAFAHNKRVRPDLPGSGRSCRVEVLRGCGHWTPLEKPEECVRLLQRFYMQRI